MPSAKGVGLVKKCCMCMNTISGDDPAVLFVGKTGDDKEVCSACEQNMEVLMESDEPEEVREAINYLYTCSLSTSDPEVASYLKETIDANSSAVEEAKGKERSGQCGKQRDYFADKQAEEEADHGGSFWISGMKFLAWVVFIVIVAFGIVSWPIVGGFRGFLMFAAFILLAFLSVAMLMIFLNLASDASSAKKELSNIRRALEKEDDR